MVRKTIVKIAKVSIIPSKFRIQAKSIIQTGQLNHLFTHLELTSIAASTLLDYLTRLLFLKHWATLNRLDWENATDLDMTLVLFFEELFWKQLAPSEGSKTLASLKFFYPQLSKLGGIQLPRSIRVLMSWEKSRPQAQRIPLPWLCLCAILGELIHRQRLVTALCLLIQFITYMRPGVCDRLTVAQLVPPSALMTGPNQFWGLHLYPVELLVPGKTGGYDLSVLLDTHPWLDPFLHVLIRGRSPEDSLWSLPGHVIRQDFLTAVINLQLSALNPCRYSLRHGGASHDALTGSRSLTEIKARGHWRSDLSVARYSKPTRALKELSLVRKSVLNYGKFVEDHLEAIFHLSLKAPPPPPE